MKKINSCLIMCAMSCAMVAQTTGEEAGHTWIDLGLPSGIKWATTNIGAHRPQDAGNYLSLIHISEPTRLMATSRMPSSA